MTPGEASAPRPGRRRVTLSLAVATLLAVALATRLGVAWLARDALPWNDQVTYVLRAEDLLDGKGYTGSYQSWVLHPGERQLTLLPRYRGAYQAPGFSVFIALVYSLTGRSLMWIKLAQVLLGTLTTYFVYRLGRDWFDRGVGLIAGWMFALEPTLIAFTHYLFNETLFIALLTPGLWILTRSRAAPRASEAVAGGVLLALASYVKSSVLFFLPVLAAWLLWVHRRELWRVARAVAIAAAAWVVCVAPWTIRNTALHDGFVLMDTSGPFNFWRGNQPAAYALRMEDTHKRFPPPFGWFHTSPVSEVGGATLADIAREMYSVREPTDLEVMRAANRRAVEFILADLGGFARRAWYKIVDTWNPTSFVMRHMTKDGYGPLAAWQVSAISWACVLSYLATMVLAVPALAARWRDSRAALVVLLILYYTALHAVTFGLTRFRLPLMPFLMVFAAVALAWLSAKLAARPAVARP